MHNAHNLLLPFAYHRISCRLSDQSLDANMIQCRLFVIFWLLEQVLSFTTHHSGIRKEAFHVDTHQQVQQRPWGSPTRNTRLASLRTKLAPSFGGMELKNVFFDDISMAFDAWEWTNAMGAPAALIGGAVLVTLSETREDLSPRKQDSKWVRMLKRSMRFLLLTSFALEVISIFVGTMTGGVLLGQGPQVASKLAGYQSPLQLLHHHFELEYLTTHICFLQGLFNWLAAVAIELLLPKRSETTSAKRMNKCLAGWLVSFILWMLAFYNNHLSFYSDYASMLRRFVVLFFKDFILATPFRPLSLLYGPSFAISSFLTWRAFTSPPNEDED